MRDKGGEYPLPLPFDYTSLFRYIVEDKSFQQNGRDKNLLQNGRGKEPDLELPALKLTLLAAVTRNGTKCRFSYTKTINDVQLG